jgi:hypothetical protein
MKPENATKQLYLIYLVTGGKYEGEEEEDVEER